jgi:small ligand-binding sensory domain FIST
MKVVRDGPDEIVKSVQVMLWFSLLDSKQQNYKSSGIGVQLYTLQSFCLVDNTVSWIGEPSNFIVVPCAALLLTITCEIYGKPPLHSVSRVYQSRK